jgi:hypothetical protein
MPIVPPTHGGIIDPSSANPGGVGIVNTMNVIPHIQASLPSSVAPSVDPK